VWTTDRECEGDLCGGVETSRIWSLNHGSGKPGYNSSKAAMKHYTEQRK
jgi:hypothetical protein